MSHEIVPVAAHAATNQMSVPPTTCGSLAEALSKSRDRCKAVDKDAKNKFHNYKYASAEAVIAAAKDALEGSGLALIPQKQDIVVNGSGNMAFHELRRRFLLIHASGEVLPLDLTWPVICEKGKPLDKAMAIAMTSSLAYLLRDLLQMPRVMPDDDISAREDREPKYRQPDYDPEDELAAAQGKPQPTPDNLTEVAASLKETSNGQVERPTHQDIDRVTKLVNDCSFSWKVVTTRLKDKYGVNSLGQLTLVQLLEVEQGIKDTEVYRKMKTPSPKAIEVDQA